LAAGGVLQSPGWTSGGSFLPSASGGLAFVPPAPAPAGASATGPSCSLPEPAAAPEAFPGGTLLPGDPALPDPGCAYIGIVAAAPLALAGAFEELPPLPHAATQ